MNRANFVRRAIIFGDVFQCWVAGSVGFGDRKEADADGRFWAGSNVATDNGAIPARASGVADACPRRRAVSTERARVADLLTTGSEC